MNLPEIFKYNSVISIPLFSLIALFLIKKAFGFSFTKSTVSKSILLLRPRTYRIIFRLNFLIKALLDFGFVWYLFNRYHLRINSVLGLSLVIAIIFWGLLSYFVEGKHPIIHKILIYSNGVFWGICQILLAQFTQNSSFIFFTNILTSIAIILAFGFLFAKKTNVFVQVICITLLYLWLLVFVFRFL